MRAISSNKHHINPIEKYHYEKISTNLAWNIEFPTLFRT